ncbi:MAG: hypothetical protein E7449_06445 [Ruminococcaceae bacterium]|nr:hypothetical protein [Oscillospiraceae bacterium]
MKDFFAKHRHLIVIALVFAIILAALTPLLVPLGLEIEEKIGLNLAAPRFSKLNAQDFQSYTVLCREHVDIEGSLFRMELEEEWTQTQSLDALCSLLNEAPEEPCDQVDGEYLCAISLTWKDESQVLYPRTGLFHLLRHPDGRYSLRGLDPRGQTVHRYISKEAAETLLAYRRCEADPQPPQSPRAHVCNTESILSATLITWAAREKSAPLELSQVQLEVLCAFLEENLLPCEYVRQHVALCHGENGWQATLSAQDGTLWHVQYNDTQRCLSLSCQFSDGEQMGIAAGYTCADETALAALPELLLGAEP